MENTQEQTVDFMFKWDLETNEFSEPDKFELELEHFDEKEQEDKFWMARTGLNLDTLAGAIETIVFMSDKPVSIIKIKNQIDEELPLRVVHEAITRLQSEYEEKHHGIRLQEVAEGYQYRTKATYSKFVQSLFKVNSLVLSPTALEVLAIIAYKQPVSKMDVEQIRGVDSSHIIRGLMDKRLVKMSGRSEEVGRPSLFGTTLEFLEVFNLPNISELPSENELEELAEGNTVGAISDIKGIVGGEKDKFNFDEMEELETLSKDINNISSDTFFTKTLNFENKQKVKAPKEGEETPVRRSAFEILEEFVNNDASLKQNQEAALSETPMNVIDARIVDVTLELSEEHGLINAPEVDEDYMDDMEAEDLTETLVESIEARVEEFEDLLTAHKLDKENAQSLLAEIEKDEEDAKLIQDLFTSEEKLELEAKELEDALDDAFANLMGDTEAADLDTTEIEMTEEESDEMDKSFKALEDVAVEATEMAKDLDIDLSFLTEEASESLSDDL